MSQILSQSEVDALLNAVNDGELETAESEGKANAKPAGGGAAASGSPGGGSVAVEEAPPEEDLNIQPYDLANQDRVIRGRLPTLDIIYERFIRQFRISLSSSLRKIASINIISTDMLKFGEFVNTLPIPSCMAILRYEELRGPALMVFESKLVYALIDSYFGGTDRPFTKIDGKEFTPIELGIIRKVIDLAISDLQDAWAPVFETTVTYIRTEVNPQFVGVVPPSDIIVSTTLEVELENASGTISIVVPYSTLEPIKQKLNASFQAETQGRDKRWMYNMLEHILHSPMNVSVDLGKSKMNVSKLMKLKEGDTIILDQDAAGELKVRVQNIACFKALYGESKGHRAVSITKSVSNEIGKEEV